ncbi:MAG: FGGY-family carbohydrate kinase [Gammaproteobacteria bacterium]|nr:FGGY-family carbohydrate kinase [Gammaproteobacteria bacterium]
MHVPAAYLGIDLGTSGCRACAIDEAGTVLNRGAVPLSASQRHGERHEQDPESWWTALIEALRALVRAVPAHRLRAVAVAGTSGTLLLTDAEGQPLGPALMYDDARSRTQAAVLARLAPAASGAHGTGSSLAKLLYLAEQKPSTRARHALHPADWIAGRLSGRFGVSDENNSLKLGYDPLRREWPDWLRRTGLPREWLPEVVPAGTPLGPITRAAAQACGLPEDLIIVAGTTDSTAAFMATGAETPGEAVTSLGSTLVLKVLSEQPVFAPGHGVYSHRVGERWLAGGASNSGGAVLRRYFSQGQLDALTPALKPDRPTGLDYYPLIAAGERFPTCDPELPPRLAPRPESDAVFFQAMLEGMAAIEQRGYRLLAELGAPFPVSVRSVGGGARNPAWTRIRQRLLNVPVIEPTQQDAAYGCAMLARRSVATMA